MLQNLSTGVYISLYINSINCRQIIKLGQIFNNNINTPIADVGVTFVESLIQYFYHYSI